MPPGVTREDDGGGGEGGKIEWKLSEVNTRAVSRGQNELIGSSRWRQLVSGGRLWSTSTFLQKSKGSW